MQRMKHCIMFKLTMNKKKNTWLYEFLTFQKQITWIIEYSAIKGARKIAFIRNKRVGRQERQQDIVYF